MTGTEFFNAALKHRKLFEAATDITDISYVLDPLMDDYAYGIKDISLTLWDLYTEYVPEEPKIASLNQIIAASDKAFVELKKIIDGAVETAEGEHVDTERLDKEAKEEGWTEEEKSEAFWADAQMDWDWFIDNLAEEYWASLQESFKRDEKLTWDHVYEVPRILRRMEKELDAQKTTLTNDAVEDYIKQNSEVEIDFDKDNVKLLVVQNAFEGYD